MKSDSTMLNMHRDIDMMDWNVISDEPGICPIFEMTLKEVSIEKAKEYLLKFGYKVK